MSEPAMKNNTADQKAAVEEAALNLANDVKNLEVNDADKQQRPSSTSSSGGRAASNPSFVASFKAFSKFGDCKSDGKQITLSQSDKWMKQAKVIDGKTVTTIDTGIYFKKRKSIKLNIEQFEAFLEDLATAKKLDLSELKHKLSNCGTPGVSSVGIGGKAASTVDRLTDVSKYTGSHKQRFDEAGKGRGIVGRKDLPDKSGYVQGYQNKDTYKAQ